MVDDFNYIQVPEHLIPALGNPDEGTRLHRAFGPDEAFDRWIAAVSEVCSPDSYVSPGGVAMFASVSRAGVHKRMKEGRLTAFLFHTTKTRQSKFTKRERIEVAGNPYISIPILECKAWAEQLETMNRKERREVQVGDGDHAGQFLLAPKPTKKKRTKK